MVTGDLVSGTRTDDKNARDTLKEQYLQAKDFILRLCKELLEGDLRRLFIIPGNHDVSFPASKDSMEEVDDVERYDVMEVLRQPESPFRWSWKELRLYSIRDVEQYTRRLASFKEFFDDLYKDLGRRFSLETHKQAMNFVTPDGSALFTGFSSLHGNDCFNRRGMISVEDVASNDLKVREAELNAIPLKVAFWHHNIEGFGYNDDHMNSSEVLPHLIDHGYSIGLHGHQHRSQVVRYAYSLNPKLVMPVIASGSLCADPYDIPAGYRRQYNVIEIDGGRASVRVHVREWFEDRIWIGARLPEFGGNTYVDLKLPILAEVLERSQQQTDILTNQNLFAAEVAVRNRDYARAVVLLNSLPKNIVLVRRLLTDTYQMLGRWSDLVKHLEKPTNADELALIVDAELKLKDFAAAEKILNSFANETGSYDELIKQLRKTLDSERKVAGRID